MKLAVMSLVTTADGYKTIVKSFAKDDSTDGDSSVAIAAAERKLTGLGYTVDGSFLETCPAAKFVLLDHCQIVN